MSLSSRTLASLTVVALLLVACGQKPGVRIEGDPLATGDAPMAQPGTGAPGNGFDDGFDDGLDDGLDDGFAMEGEAGAEVGQPGSPEGTGGQAQQGQQQGQQQQQAQQRQQQQAQQRQPQQRQPQGSDRTGVTDSTITVAIHAPVTGAAPLPSTSFEKARDLYWRWITEAKGETVLGRDRVEVMFSDDRFEPATARQVCRQLASRAFLVVGGGGTDQIQACGELAGRERFPYFSPGVTEAGLAGNPWYFAISMTYKQQGPLMAQYVRRQFGNARVAAVVTQTPNFNDAVEGWEAGVRQHNLNYYQTLRHPRGDTGWYSGFANRLAQEGVEVVYLVTSPLDYIRFAQVAQDQGHSFQWIGPGVTSGLNDVLRSGCPAVSDGIFFSPFPALETANRLDPDFNRAAQRFGTPNDDIAWALWGIAKTTHELFKRYERMFGNDLTREDFRAVVSNAGTVESGIFPPARFSPQSHFAGTGVHVLKADCQTRQYRDGGTFRSSF